MYRSTAEEIVLLGTELDGLSYKFNCNTYHQHILTPNLSTVTRCVLPVMLSGHLMMPCDHCSNNVGSFRSTDRSELYLFHTPMLHAAMSRTPMSPFTNVPIHLHI